MARADLVTDLVVMGAGVTGLSVAWAAARRGARVVVVDPAGIGAGASGGVVGALMPHQPERWTETKAFQLEALLMAAEWWGAVQAAAGLPTGFGRTGRLQPLADDAAVRVARDRGQAVPGLWSGRAAWHVLAAPPGWAPESATGLVISDTLSARIRPAWALQALAEAIRASGGRIVAQAPATTAPVVWATGVAGLADLSAVFGRAVGAPVKGQAAVLAFDAGEDAAQIYADGLHIVPHADGTVAVGSTSETSFADPAATDHQLDAIVLRARRACPCLADAPVILRWAGLRPRARTRNPLMGPWPGRAGHFVANGGFKIGFGIAPLVAEVMADLVLQGHDRVLPAFRVEAAL
ncbi:MAG: FAD-dependent oxidoreductase [Paracoccaceae bacterium]|nr:MAG: FAD-dependent oxidoreductase [Paracoccaceae bacterium]